MRIRPANENFKTFTEKLYYLETVTWALIEVESGIL